MRSFFQNKSWVLLFSVLALGALTVLALGLRDVSFREAESFGRNEAEGLKIAPPNLAGLVEKVPLRSQIIFWVAVTLLMILVAMLLSPQARKYLIRLFLRVVITYWMLYFLLKNYGDKLVSMLSINILPGQANSAGNESATPPPVFIPPGQSSWISYLVSLGIVLFVVFLAWRIVHFWREFSASHEEQGSLEKIARIARSSLRDLTEGKDSTDVILNCYFRMNDVVADKRRLQRRDSTTPAEFAVRLEQAGLPGDAVQRLTRLFEGVRYGERRSGLKEVNEAVACLTTIVQYCGETV